MKRRPLSWIATILLVMLLAQVSLAATDFSVVFNFDGTHGSEPVEEVLAEDKDGNMWGTTLGGGDRGDGTIFKLTPDGSITTIYSFDVWTAPFGLVLGVDGNFYGVGVSSGVVYRVTPLGEYTVLHTFRGDDGTTPSALIQAKDGSFYGTTQAGGSKGGGTIFKITPAGVFTKLYDFESYQPYQQRSLMQANDGMFYGVALLGGSSKACTGGCGTVFRFNPTGKFKVIHEFAATDGSGPNSLMQARDGRFYGTTYEGGDLTKCQSYDVKVGCGTVFRINTKGTHFKTLRMFEQSNGNNPEGPLVEGPDGRFYGVCESGSPRKTAGGNVYSIGPSGSLKILHVFSGPDGLFPEGGLLQHSNGKLYGTTQEGGTGAGGVVFSVDVGFTRPQK